MEQNERVTVEYEKIKLGDGKEYKVKPLSLKATKTILPLVQKMDETRGKNGMTEEVVDLMAEVCLAILQPTNTELTKDNILDIVEMDDVQILVALAMGMGMKDLKK